MEGEDKPDQSKWSQYLQFIWALLGDPRRLRRLIVVFITVVVAFALVKGSVAGIYYDIEQHLPAWAKTVAISVGVGGTTTSSVGFSVYRRYRRARRENALPGEGSVAKSVTQAPADDDNGALGEPAEAEREHPGNGNPGSDPRGA
jgi:hypothetical protein